MTPLVAMSPLSGRELAIMATVIAGGQISDHDLYLAHNLLDGSRTREITTEES